MTRSSSRAARAVLLETGLKAGLLVGVLAVVVAPLAAEESDALLSGFEPTGIWRLALDGKDLPKVEIYENTRAASLLVMSSEIASPLLVDTGSRQVSTLQLLKVYKRADGRVDLLADAVLEPVSSIEIVGLEARFTLDRRAGVLKPSPFLLGDQRGPALLDSNFGYRWRAKSYEPDSAVIGRLRSERRDVRVLTFFGSWCPHCSRNLPLLLKVEQRLADARIKFDYHGLPQQGMSSEPAAAKWKIDGVPTAIVFLGDEEIGRIPAASWGSPEVALDLILHPERGNG